MSDAVAQFAVEPTDDILVNLRTWVSLFSSVQDKEAITHLYFSNDVISFVMNSNNKKQGTFHRI